jgi:hypothetical protein
MGVQLQSYMMFDAGAAGCAKHADVLLLWS